MRKREQSMDCIVTINDRSADVDPRGQCSILAKHAVRSELGLLSAAC
jgi:hypothetical protein